MRVIDRVQRVPISICAMLLALLLPIHAWAQQASPKIGYVDMRRLIDNAPQVAASRARIEAEFVDRDRQLKAEQARLDDLIARERRDALVMSKADADALRREIQTRTRSIELTRKKLNEELSARGKEEVGRRWPEITDAVIEYARANGYDLVLPAPLLYASARVDITDEVLATLIAKSAADGTR
jgi:outer membrane protein